MKKQALQAAIAVTAMSALSGCSVLGIDFDDEKVKYESSNSRANLEVPPDLTPIGNDNRFQVPGRTSVVSANAEAARRQAEMDAAQTTTGAAVLPTTVVAKVMKDGAMRWLRVNVAPEQLWPVVQDFWPSIGLVVKAQDPKTGYMETEWAENRAKLPQDIIRSTIGKVIDFAYSTGEQDQYRLRMERNDDGTTDLFVTHRSMVEVVTGAQKDSSVWQPGPTDPMLEAEILQRLALRIDAEFNPNAKPEENLQRTEELKEALKPEPAPIKNEVVTNAEGVPEAVVVPEPFDRAWRTVSLVIDRMAFELVDRDRASGYFLVRYLDPDYEAAKKSEQGFFTNLFGSDKAVEPPQYRIHLGDEGLTTRITVQSADGGPDATGVAPKILNLLAEQLR